MRYAYLLLPVAAVLYAAFALRTALDAVLTSIR
jgi:hypothetical protein